MVRFCRSRSGRGAAPTVRARWRTRKPSLALLALAALVLCVFVAPAAAFGASEPPVSEPAAVGSATGQVLVTLQWGDKDGQVGLARTKEGLTRGPEAIAIAPDGRIAVLDSVNRRLVLLDQQGRQLGIIAVNLSQPRFLAVDDELLYVLDADSQKRLATYDWSEGLVDTQATPAFAEVVTGLFATSQGPCIEIAHRDSLLLAGSGGMPALASGKSTAGVSPRQLSGRPVDRDLRRLASATYRPKEGARLHTATVETTTLQVDGGADSQPLLAGGAPIEHLVSLDGDGHGGLLVGARLVQPQMRGQTACPLAITRVTQGAATVDGSLRAAQGPEEGVLLLAESGFAYLGQPYAVAPDGRIFQPVGSESGYTILVHIFPEVQS
jgi:hypothetical protein